MPIGEPVPVLEVDDVQLELEAHRVRVAGRAVPLPAQEMRLLSVLMERAGHVLTRRELLDLAWGPGYPDHNKTLEVHIRRLRVKLDTPGCPSRIRTVFRLGYIFDVS